MGAPRPTRPRSRFAAIAVLALSISPAVAAQQGGGAPAVTDSDYARAERFLSWNTAPLVMGEVRQPNWLDDGRLTYTTSTSKGTEFIVADPAHKRREAAFDQAAVATALAAATHDSIDPWKLPFARFDYADGGKSIAFDYHGKHWVCGRTGGTCASSKLERPDRNAVTSPDGKQAVFIKDWNLWLRDLATGKETQLTTDGVTDFGYATDNAGWTHSDKPIVLWSPDSKKIATFQQDQRNTGMMYLVETQVGHPTLQAWHYPLPGDSAVTMIHRGVIDLSGTAPKVVRVQMPADQHRSTYCDDVACRGDLSDTQWSPDGSQVAFVSVSRDHKVNTLRVADAATGAVRDVLTETSPTQYESGFDHANWHVLFPSNEVIWFSERDNWGHLYLYDLKTGKLKNQITSGNWPVLYTVRYDDKNRTVYFVGAGREPGDPYFQHLYRVGLDGKGLTLLTPDSANHQVSLSADGRWFLDASSTPDQPPVSVIRDAKGRVVMPVEKADVSRLAATGWTPPIPFTVKARDGRTDLYGLMYRPSGFDSTRKYPIVVSIYPGPQIGSVGGRSFSPSRGDTRALAELGFIVVQLDAMGTPERSKSFHDAYYGDMGDNGLPDQVAGVKQLAARYPWIDLDRVGIYGHSGGGFATADAMFRYPDFFKVGVAEAGNHDNREYEDDWGERYQGLLTNGPDGGTNYDNQANQLVAKNLKGHLLIAYGTTDDNVPPFNSLLVVNELIKANRDFDLLALPNRRHGFGAEPYMIRRRWDYFVRYLLGAEPPHEYEIRVPERRGR